MPRLEMSQRVNSDRFIPHFRFASGLVATNDWVPEVKASFQKDLDRIQTRLDDKGVNISIVGEFSSGKSSLINAMLGVNLLEMDDMPDTTLVPVVIYYAPTPILTIERKGGATEVAGMPVEEIRRKLKEFSMPEFEPGKSDEEYIANLTKAREIARERAAGIVQFTIGLPSDFLKRGFRLIDTPGLNSNNRRCCEITASLMRLTDASIIVVNGCQGIMTESFREELSEALGDRLHNCMVVYTRFDLISRRERFRTYAEATTPTFFNLTPEQMPVFMAVPPAVIASVEGKNFGAQHREMLQLTLASLEKMTRYAIERRDRTIGDSLVRLIRKIYEKLENNISAMQTECRQRLERLERSRTTSIQNFIGQQHQRRTVVLRSEIILRKQNLEKFLDSKIKEINDAISKEISSKSSLEQLDNFMTNNLRLLLETYAGQMERMVNEEYSALCSKAEKEASRFFKELSGEFQRLNIVPVKLKQSYKIAPITCRPLMDSMKEAVDLTKSERERQNASVGMAVIGGVIGSVLTFGIGTAVGAALGAMIGSGGKASGIKAALPKIREKYTLRLGEALAKQKTEMVNAFLQGAVVTSEAFSETLRGSQKRYQEAIDKLIREENAQQVEMRGRITELGRQLEQIVIHQKEIEELWKI